MTVGRKISLAFALLVLLTGIVAAIALYRVAGIRANLQTVTGQSLPGVYIVGKLAQLNRVISGNILLHLGVPGQRQPMEAKIQAGQKQFSALMLEYGKSIATDEERQLYDGIGPVYRRYCDVWEKLRPISTAGDSVTAWRIWVDEGRPAMLDLEQKLNSEIEFSRTIGARRGAATTQAVTQAQVWILAFLIISMVSGGGLAFVIVGGLNRQLHRTARDLNSGAAEVAGSAAQVASSSQSLAAGATQQAASLQETAASTEELTAMTRHNMENSRLASEAMSGMEAQVEESNLTLKDMLASMEGIRASSDTISRIIRTIDEIAFQTNILALNAAVEAARAGEAGLGFAVVADEVRNLAQRAAEAARETASLVEDSRVKSAQGSGKVQRVADIVGAITEGSGRVRQLVAEVHASSREQARGIEQIASAIAQIDRVTQTTASGAEESAAASQQLSAQASGLKDAATALGMLIG